MVFAATEIVADIDTSMKAVWTATVKMKPVSLDIRTNDGIFYLYGTCKFGDGCVYVHGESEDKVKIRCLEEKLSLFEAKVIRLERSVTDLVIKLDTFMCMENSGDDSIDKVIDVTEDVIETVAPLKHQDKFGCHLCDFASNRQNGLVIHMGRKHKKDISNPIVQFYGNATNDDEDINEV